MNDHGMKINRRGLLGGAAGLVALKATGARAQAPALPKAPVAINVIDVGGALALMTYG
jgi:putative spermidine/putrescine transport system substrate-binding protein